MAKYRPPEHIEIASLRQQQSAAAADPMAAGAGTPWEDRGSHGTVGAFFKTATMALTQPGRLANLIRRPETTGDTRALVIGCAIAWALSAGGHTAFFTWLSVRHAPTFIDVNTQTCVVYCILAMLAAGLGTYLLFRMFNRIYGGMIAQEARGPALPDVLIYNVNAYVLTPSILALVPFAGPVLAFLWIYVDLIAVGRSRLRLRTVAAVIDATLALLAVLAIIVAGWYLGNLLLHYTVGAPWDPQPGVNPNTGEPLPQAQ